jgi:hypothetical protein
VARYAQALLVVHQSLSEVAGQVGQPVRLVIGEVVWVALIDVQHQVVGAVASPVGVVNASRVSSGF